MTKNVLTFLVAVAACSLITADAQAQCAGCGGSGIGSRVGARVNTRIGLVRGAIASANTGLPTAGFIRPKVTIKAGAQDFFSPHRLYPYGNAGAEATQTHDWNNVQQNVFSWHGGFKNSQFGTPTALVVPPTASYGSSYAWGVGQVRSTPIYHQFGRGPAANVGGGNGSWFQETPYWPGSTDQFGVYSVRAPW